MKRWRKRILGLLVLGMTGGGLLWWWGNHRIVSTTKDRIYDEVASVPPRYVAIVLGAKVWGGEPSDILEDRLQTALDLLKANKVQKLLVTGDHGKKKYDEVNAMRDWLIRNGAPEDLVFLDHAGFRTNDSMQRAAKVFQVKDAIVVTQRFHLPRSLYLAEHAGIDAVGIVADKHRYRSEKYNALRESAARASAFLEVNLLGTSPKFLGEPHPITGNPESTKDRL